jgi:hypothetical protein
VADTCLLRSSLEPDSCARNPTGGPPRESRLGQGDTRSHCPGLGGAGLPGARVGGRWGGGTISTHWCLSAEVTVQIGGASAQHRGEPAGSSVCFAVRAQP